MTPAADTRAQRLAATHSKLVDAVAELTTGDVWRRMLTVAARFPSYSPSNVLLIGAQRPDATRVAGIRTWNSLGRRVRAGERGIAILAPCVYRAARDTNSTGDRAEPDGARQLRGFRVVHVFDVTQTEGDELPDVAPVLLAGGVPAGLWDRLAGCLRADGFALERGDCAGANGYTRFDQRTVRIRADLPDAQATKTLAHELGHIRADHETRLLDDYRRSPDCRGAAEVEAESIAYVVLTAAGVDTSGYSVPYIAGWAGGDLDTIRSTASRCLNAAAGLLDELNLSPRHPGDGSPVPSAAPVTSRGGAPHPVPPRELGI